jgi:hypothetical protein
LLDTLMPLMSAVPASNIWIPTARAVIELAEGSAERAVELTNTALANSARFGMKHYLTEGPLVLARAEALYAAGRKAEAREGLGRMREDLLTRAERIRDPAYARSFIDGVFVHARTLALYSEWG